MKALLSSTLVLLLMTTSCHEEQPQYQCEGTFSDKSLDHLRSCLAGTWQLHYAIRGIGGPRIQILT
ncbi:MAG: hypothetical protein OEX02_16750 [Cyclobacteriaceae bacterium]|nr:hypothetical protein [Cyclobacteriaceae bacterium]